MKIIGNADDVRKYTLVASAAYSTVETKTFDTVPLMKAHQRMEALLVLTAAGTLVGDTLDVLLDFSPDDGTTWINAAHFTQILGNGADSLTFAAVFDTASPGTSILALATDLTAGNVRPAVCGTAVRVRHTIANGGGTHSFTYSLVLYGLD